MCNRYPWNFCYIQGNLRLVRKIFKSYGWNEVKPEAESAQLTWSLADLADSKKYEFYHRLTPGTVVNHFPGIFELGNKKYLNINLKDYYNTFGEAFADFFPVSFEVDKEMQQFKMAHEKLLSRQSDMDEAPMWVLKDPVGDRGEGVKVISGPQDLLHDDRRGLIVQQYIGNPYLLNGFKFTVRAYVSFQISLLELTLRNHTHKYTDTDSSLRSIHFVFTCFETALFIWLLISTIRHQKMWEMCTCISRIQILTSIVRIIRTWCSSAKRENFNQLLLLCHSNSSNITSQENRTNTTSCSNTGTPKILDLGTGVWRRCTSTCENMETILKCF